MNELKSSAVQAELSRADFSHTAENDPAREQTPPGAFGWTPPILSSFPSPLQVLRGMVRRWPLTIVLGALGATLLAAAGWRLAPNQYRAEAWIEVQSLPPGGHDPDGADMPAYL